MNRTDVIPQLIWQFLLLSLVAIGGANAVLPEMHRQVVEIDQSPQLLALTSSMENNWGATAPNHANSTRKRPLYSSAVMECQKSSFGMCFSHSRFL